MQENLKEFGQREWDRYIQSIQDGIHPVDREAIQIWFAMWPLKLRSVPVEGDQREEIERDWELNGNFDLATQLAHSVRFLWAAPHFPSVCKAVLEQHNEFATRGGDLIEEIAGDVARKLDLDPSLLISITAAASLALVQLGTDALQSEAGRSSAAGGRPSPEVVLKRRSDQLKHGFFSFLSGADQKFRVTFDEASADYFEAFESQDLSMASASDTRDYAVADPRRLEGPVPFQCRSGSCGFCWVGVLGGRERLAPLEAHEKRRLEYFGYRSPEAADESHPPIRLACQAACKGDVTIVVPPWNGTLKGRN